MRQSHVLLFLIGFFCLCCGKVSHRPIEADVPVPEQDTLRHITLLFAGDLMQHKPQVTAAATAGGYDYTECFRYMKPLIERADVAIANLEVTFGGKPYTGYPTFSAPDDFLKGITEAGFDVLLTSNNHCLDRGKLGLERTLAVLDSCGVPHIGTYRDDVEREQAYPFLLEKNGFRIALLNFTYDTNGIEVTPPNVVNYIDTLQLAADISKAHAMNPDVVIACPHWGIEYKQLPSEDQKELAQWLLDHGVDHVIGGHPHVVQPMEVLSDGRTLAKHLVVFSMGNYVSNMSDVNTDGGAQVMLHLSKYAGVTKLDSCSYSLYWVSKPKDSGHKNYRVYPATVSPDSLNSVEKSLLNHFLTGARRLFSQRNIGIEEKYE